MNTEELENEVANLRESLRKYSYDLESQRSLHKAKDQQIYDLLLQARAMAAYIRQLESK